MMKKVYQIFSAQLSTMLEKLQAIAEKAVNPASKEDIANKVSEITEENKHNSTKYPSNAAIVNYLLGNYPIMKGNRHSDNLPILTQNGHHYNTYTLYISSNGLYFLEYTTTEPNYTRGYSWKVLYANPVELNSLPEGGTVNQFVDGEVCVPFYSGNLVTVAGKIYECTLNLPSSLTVPLTYTYTWREVDTMQPLVVECDMAFGNPQSDYIPIFFSNPTASFSDVVDAYESGREILVKGTITYGNTTLELITSLIGAAKNSVTIQHFAFREAIPPTIINSIFPSWGAYDCFIDISCDTTRGWIGQLTCNTVTVLGNIETQLSQV